jgi:hypothetical protein
MFFSFQTLFKGYIDMKQPGSLPQYFMICSACQGMAGIHP